MKSILRSLTLTVLAAGLALGVTSCADDAGSSPPSNNTNNPPVNNPEEPCTDADQDGAFAGESCLKTPLDCDDDNNERAPDNPEICDGIDNDCDGDVDEDLVAQACELTQGVCAGAEQACKGADGFASCGAAEYGADYADVEDGATNQDHCDGLDNDCDGVTDEGCPCEANQVVQCGSSQGECARGLQNCINGYFGPCEGATEPTDEICDGLDNDCDGQIDEDLPAPDCSVQVGVCAGAKQKCMGTGGWAVCGATEFGSDWVAVEDPTINSSVCDGLDNDCDGITDEDCTCTDGAEQPCGSDVGECAAGIQTCAGGTWGSCRNAVEGGIEVCDGLDNDCDGQVDEDLAAPSCALSSGVCVGTVQTCGEDGWLACGGVESYGDHYVEIEDPTADGALCDGFDNDCDGFVDEGCSCNPGEIQPCGSNIGTCVMGQQSCSGGQFGACEGEVTPVAEICDGLDNDCDSSVDEDLVGPDCLLTAGVCAGAKQHCAAADGFVPCDAFDYGFGYEVDEVACDGRDNDCDGEIDEGCDCLSGAIQNCGSNVGICEFGTQTCVRGAWSACDGEVTAETEICDGLDNDCDGAIDEDLVAPDCALFEGVCAGAHQVCEDTGFAACTGPEYGSSYEVTETSCDGLDNDCDGHIDVGCNCLDDATQVCGSNVGACVAGLQTCAGGNWGACDGEVTPTAETCNGLDDDCDTFTDEDLVQDCPLQLGVCANTSVACTGGVFSICGANEYGPNYEIDEVACDGLDNDCDGLVDEDCGVPTVVISEVLYDPAGSDAGKAWIELAGDSGTNLGGLSLVGINGANGTETQVVALPNLQIPFNDFFLVVDDGAQGTLKDIADFEGNVDLQNGPDSVQLVWNKGTSAELIVDSVGYGVFGGTVVFGGEGEPTADVMGGHSITRDDLSSDSDNNLNDFVDSDASTLGVPTPGGYPVARIHVNLSWGADVDVDLHFLDDGATWEDTVGDCYWLNRNPEWGVVGEALDDPRLDRDDTDGDGPEYLDLVLPAAASYLVEVDLFSPNVASVPANVGIFVDGGGESGVNEYTFSRSLTSAERYWAVAAVEVAADGTVTVTELDLVDSTPIDN